jgi:hypothetical protein
MRNASRFAVLALAGAWLLAGQCGTVLAQYPTTVIAKVFDPAPDGNGMFNGFTYRAAALNDADQAVFWMNLYGTIGGSSDNAGIFRGDGGPLAQIARLGQFVPGGNGKISDLYTDLPVLNDAGQVAFRAFLNGTSGGAADNSAIYRGDGSALVQIARKGQADPGGNGLITNLDLPPAINSAGQVAFSASLGGTSGGTADNSAIYRGNGGTLTQIVRKGQPAPGGIGTFSAMTTPDLNDAGQASFLAFLSTGGNGIYRGDGGAPVQIARAGQAVPGGNGTIANLGGFGTPPLSDAGQIVFRATLAGTSGGSTDNIAIYRGDGGALAQIARTGQAVPDGNGTFADLSDLALGSNNAGQAAFIAAMTGTSGGASDARGIFRGDGVNLVQIVRLGQALPDGYGTFFGFDTPALNDAGQVAFITAFEGDDRFDAMARGIYLYDDALGLIKVARTGDAMLGSRIYSLAFSSGVSGANSDGTIGLNDWGHIAFNYILENGYSGIAVITIPELATLSGDANRDGKVSFADYLILEANFAKTGATWAMGDFNNDGKVSFADYLLLEANFGKSVPEPATLSLLALSGLAMIRRRR